MIAATSVMPNDRETIPPAYPAMESASYVPTRSELFPLSPMGIGTPFVESLTGYLGRLAGAHSLFVSDLIETDRFRLLGTLNGDRRTRRRLFHASCFLLDGSGLYTRKWIDSIEAATTQEGLSALTLLPYINICGDSWLRRIRAWCPLCLEMWRLSGETVYEPLLWAIKVVSICPMHKVLLLDTCPICHKTYAPLGGVSSPGHCGHCRAWLGTSLNERADHRDDYRLWCAEQMCKLIVASVRFKLFPGPDTVREGLSYRLRSLTPTSLDSLSTTLKCSRRSLTTWLRGTTQPRIESLCRLSFQLGVSPLDLIAGQSFGRSDVPTSSKTLRVNKTVRKVSEIRIQASLSLSAYVPLENQKEATTGEREEQLRIALQDALADHPTRSARNIAKSIGYSSPDRVLKKFPDLCTALEARRREHVAVHEYNIRTCLENALLQSPPPTLQDLAKKFKMSSSSALRAREPVMCDRLLARRKTWRRENESNVEEILSKALNESVFVPFKRFCKVKGISPGLVMFRFPELKVAYDDRYHAFRMAQRAQRLQKFNAEVREAVLLLKGRNEYPSVGRVLTENSSLRSGGWTQIQEAIRLALRSSFT